MLDSVFPGQSENRKGMLGVSTPERLASEQNTVSNGNGQGYSEQSTCEGTEGYPMTLDRLIPLLGGVRQASTGTRPEGRKREDPKKREAYVVRRIPTNARSGRCDEHSVLANDWR